jgi:hypothetical protein
MARILFATEHDTLSHFHSLSKSKEDVVVFAFCLSKEAARSIAPNGTREVMRLNDTVGDYSAHVEKAYLLAHSIAETSPLYRGVKPILTLEESLADAFLRCLMIGDIHKALVQRYGGGSQVVFLTESESQNAFSVFNSWRKAPFRISVLGKPQRGIRRTARRIRALANVVHEAKQESNWSKIISAPLEVVDDRYKLRSALWPEASVKKGGRWFYGSFINSIRILHRYLANLEGESSWVVNRFPAARGLEAGDRWHYLWQFGKPARRIEHERFLQEARKYLATLPSEIDNFPMEVFSASSVFMTYFFKRLLPLVLAEVDLMHVFLERSSPEELWVANQWGSEGGLIQVAKKLSIPVTQVQHGALHRYYPVAPIRTSRFFVWGQFWKDRLKASERGKVEVFNPGLDVVPVEHKRQSTGKKRITFLTAPIHAIMFWHPDAILREVSALVKDLVNNGYAVIMRLHPSDQIAPWRRALEEAIGSITSEVRFSKEESLASVLQETDLAVMFFSTVFLNCVAGGIPVIGLGWYPHIWQKPLEQSGMVHFAASVGEVVALADQLLQQPHNIKGTEQFLATRSFESSVPISQS